MRIPALRRGRRAGTRPYTPWSFSALAEPFSSLHEEIDHLFDEFAQNSALNDGRHIGFAFPPIDLTEKDGNLILAAELPGLDEDDVEVSVRGDRLVIKGEKKSHREEKDETRHILERAYGMFERDIALGFEPDPEKINAEAEHGVLRVTIPKPAGAIGEAKRIKVSHKK